jgi:L-fuculose-phosphate aldolase
MDEQIICRDIAATMRRLYNQKLTTCSGGNISQRSGSNYFITASRTDKGNMQESDICVLNSEGVSISQGLKPSMESAFHMAIYYRRSDVGAVVHAHPLFATAYACSGKKMNYKLSGESWALCGEPAWAEYRRMGSKDLADAVADASQKSDIILLQNHGVITLGKTLYEAYEKMEVIEMTARLSYLVESLGSARSLDDKQLKDIDALFGK